MRIKTLCRLTSSLLLCMNQTVFALENMAAEMKHEHGGQIFHRFQLETDYGDHIGSLDFDGWIGTDENKLWLKSEASRKNATLEDSEIWALYSRNIATFWDAQIGIRQDTQPLSISYLTFGFAGLAPYQFETEAHFFLSEKGDWRARLRGENDFLLTNKLVLQPYLEINFSAQTEHEEEIGSGITQSQVGVQTRYEFTRKFAIYSDIYYEQKWGETASIAEENSEDTDEFKSVIGVRLMF